MLRSTRWLGALAACAIGLLAGTAMAAAGETGSSSGFGWTNKAFNRGGFYVGAGGATGFGTRLADEIQKLVYLDSFVLVPVQNSNTTGFNGRIGGGGRWVSGELQFEYLPSFAVESPAFASLGGSLEYSMFVMTTNLKITLPAGRFEPYFVFGLGMSRSKVETIPVSFFAESSLDAALRGGGGLNFYLTRNLALTADVTYVWTGATDNEYLDYVSVSYGMLVKF